MCQNSLFFLIKFIITRKPQKNERFSLYRRDDEISVKFTLCFFFFFSFHIHFSMISAALYSLLLDYSFTQMKIFSLITFLSTNNNRSNLLSENFTNTLTISRKLTPNLCQVFAKKTLSLLKNYVGKR